MPNSLQYITRKRVSNQSLRGNLTQQVFDTFISEAESAQVCFVQSLTSSLFAQSVSRHSTSKRRIGL